MPTITQIEPGNNRTILVVVAHADDPALFLGGTIARWTENQWNVIVVRVTDDRWDSVGKDESTTIRDNSAEFQSAMQILGVSHIIDLGWPTDTLGDASEVALREQIIRLIRMHTPHTLVTFDPYSRFAEDNEDHKLVANATDEAFWTSQFDKHHPEHEREGLRPHGCFERWYFGRSVGEVTDVVDIGGTLEKKILAVCAHKTMLMNFANQLRLQASTGGWSVPLLDEVLSCGNVALLMEPLLRAGAARTGAQYQISAGEEFRVVRFGGLTTWLDKYGIKN